VDVAHQPVPARGDLDPSRQGGAAGPALPGNRAGGGLVSVTTDLALGGRADPARRSGGPWRSGAGVPSTT
jgi:hypothetical protein